MSGHSSLSKHAARLTSVLEGLFTTWVELVYQTWTNNIWSKNLRSLSWSLCRDRCASLSGWPWAPATAPSSRQSWCRSRAGRRAPGACSPRCTLPAPPHLQQIHTTFSCNRSEVIHTNVRQYAVHKHRGTCAAQNCVAPSHVILAQCRPSRNSVLLKSSESLSLWTPSVVILLWPRFKVSKLCVRRWSHTTAVIS